MNNKYKLIPRITLWVLLAICIIVSVMFYLPYSEGTLEVAGDCLNIPKYTDLLLSWNYILFGIVTLVTLCAAIAGFISQAKVEPKKAIVRLVVVLAFFGLGLLSYALGSAEELQIIGYEGDENVGFMAQLSDGMLYWTYSMFCLTILSLICGVIYKQTRK